MPDDGPGPTERVIVPGLGRLPAFSHAAVAGDLIFVSGTLGTQGEGFELAPGGAGPETAQTLSNIERILAEAGATLDDVVKVNVYMADMSQFGEMNKAYQEFFSNDPPARITVGGARLALGAAVEIDCVARRPAARSAERPTARAVERSSGFVETGGERVYYESTGSGDAVLFCHGMGGNHAIWFQQVPAFAHERRVVTWDQRGFGRSTNRGGQPTPASAVADLAALLDHLEIERAHLIGQSMGGWAVVGLALQHPERVRSLTVADSIGGIYTAAIEEQFDRYIAESAGRPAPDRLPLGEHPALGSLAARNPARAFLYQQLQSLGEPPPDEARTALRQTRYERDDLARLRVPTLFVVGDVDPIFPPKLIYAAAALVPGARLVEIPESGHSPYFEQPERWNAEVLAFIGAS